MIFWSVFEGKLVPENSLGNFSEGKFQPSDLTASFSTWAVVEETLEQRKLAGSRISEHFMAACQKQTGICLIFIPSGRFVQKMFQNRAGFFILFVVNEFAGGQGRCVPGHI